MKLSLTRLRTSLRYKGCLRLGLMSYVILVLVVVVFWSFQRRLISSIGSEPIEIDPIHVGHHHGHKHEHSLIFRTHTRPEQRHVKRTTQNRHKPEVVVFSTNTYPANHSHPVRVVPPKADFKFNNHSFHTRCSVVRMVEFFGQKLALTDEPLCRWLESPDRAEGGNYVAYGNEMALLFDVVLDPSKHGPGPLGGEDMEEVWGQKEHKEYLDLQEGFFTLQCPARPTTRFGLKDHLNQWQAAVRCVDDASSVKAAQTVQGLTVAVQRYEYVNFYHTMTDFYNAFLAMLAFDQHPDNVAILWVDAHPKGGLDDTWDVLFGRTQRAARLPASTRFSAMAWAAMGYNSPLNQHQRPAVGYLDEFRHFFLSRHGVQAADRGLNCTSLNLLFIWRRDYVAHPRNKGGSVSRKILNEDELLEQAKAALAPGDRVQGLQLDSLPMKQQLQLVADADILVGMHGAGLSHTLFLPAHGGLVELYPVYWPQSNRHFRAMAAWRKLHYESWQNHDPSNEKENHLTYIPPLVLVRMVKTMRNSMCGET